MGKFASYLGRVLCKTRLIFPRINGPNVAKHAFYYYFFWLFYCGLSEEICSCHLNSIIRSYTSVPHFKFHQANMFIFSLPVAFIKIIDDDNR